MTPPHRLPRPWVCSRSRRNCPLGAARCSSGSSRDGGAVSPDRDGWRQIRRLATESGPRDTMIAAMSELLSNPPADWPSATTVYRLAYPPAYSDIYNRVKEMS
jgi:hypothetical protein